MQTLKLYMPAVLIAGAMVLLALVLLFKPITQVYGSTARGSEYQATTTQSSANAFPAEEQLQSTGGTLGSMTVWASANTTGTIALYDATTSSVLLRAANMATSSILIGYLPATPTVGTYTVDRIFVNGLYVVTTGIVPTTTITYRQ